MSDRLPENEREELHRRRNEDTIRRTVEERVRPIVEEMVRRLVEEIVWRVVCEVCGVDWQADGSHKKIIRENRETLERLADRAVARRSLFTAFGASGRDKISAAIWLALLAWASMWLSRKFGIVLPGFPS